LSFPVTTEGGNSSVLVVCDYFSKWVEAFALPDHQAVTVADILVTELFCRFGTPRFIHSDKAPEFMGECLTEICRLLEIKKTNTTPYRPQSDGLVERFNRTLIGMLSKLCSENQTDWDTFLPYVMCAYRATQNDSTGYSPNKLMLGHEITLPIDLMFRDPEDYPYGCHHEYVEWVRGALAESFHLTRNSLGRAATRQKKDYDKCTKDHEFELGSLVWRHYEPMTNNKLNRPYTGPYTIIDRPGEVTYTIQRVGSEAEGFNVHADHLKKCHHPNPWKQEVDEPVIARPQDLEDTLPYGEDDELAIAEGPRSQELEETMPYGEQPESNTAGDYELREIEHPAPESDQPTQMQLGRPNRPVRQRFLPARLKDCIA
jgi:hypothetical protein